MTRTVLVTGATGFVGRQVLAALARRDVLVRVVTRNRAVEWPGRSANLESILSTQDVFAETDTWWRHALDGVDTVIHAAWYAEPGKYLQSPQNLACLEGTLRLARVAAEQHLRRFIGLGTCFEYDVEQCRLSVTTPLRPTSLYASAKASVFLTLSQLFDLTGTEFAWCRLFYLYGEGEDPRRLVPYIRAQLKAGLAAQLTSGEQLRDYLDVSMAGEMIADVALDAVRGPINICSGKATSVRQLAERVADEYGRRDLLMFGTRPDNIVDPACVVGVR